MFSSSSSSSSVHTQHTYRTRPNQKKPSSVERMGVGEGGVTSAKRMLDLVSSRCLVHSGRIGGNQLLVFLSILSVNLNNACTKQEESSAMARGGGGAG